MDRLTSMAVFVRVVQEGGFAAAAGAFGISGTMVGKHVAALEDRLGVRLLHRTTRRQSLTESGRAYLERCKDILAQVREAEANASALASTPRGRLRVSAPVSLGSHVLAPALGDFLGRYPEIEVELHLSDHNVDLAEDGYDAAIRVGTLPDSSLIARPLAPYRLVACASRAYLDAHGTPRTPRDLVGHNCLGFLHWPDRVAWQFHGRGGPQTVLVKGNLETNNGQALRMAALQGLGIILQPELLLAPDLAAGRLRQILAGFAGPSRPMHLLYLPGRPPPPKLRAFIDFVAERLRRIAKV